ncbi:efflux RND transporter permease subunit [Brumimicrobium mesophilum]|uniref:efflux RND transporter permease subunit n=1 Tax=Brumimicrobium mesophilum TaxID=392717 RepID=UPI000D14023C|nr:MMPL family transporter [Brumimicrobium mesophilum]
MEKNLKRISYFVISIILITTIFFAFQLPKTTLNYNFEEFFPAQDKETDFFFNHRALFESDNDFILIAIEREKGIFDKFFLNEVNEYSKELAALPNVKFTRDITHEKETFIYTGGTRGERPYIQLDSTNFAQDSINIYKNKELINTLVNSKGNALTVFVRHNDFLSKAKSEQLVADVKQVSEKFDFENVRMAGRSVGQLYYVDTMITEMTTYVGMSILLVIVFLIISFKSLWGLMVPQIVIVGSMIWIVGIMALIGKPINILLIVLPSIMFVVAMSDVIHLMSKYLELLRSGSSKLDAIKTSFKEIGMATFLTSLTTSIGFFSLLFVNVIPIQDFGLYTGIGVLIAFVITYGSLPFLFYLTKVPEVGRRNDRNFWKSIMRKVFLITMRNRKIIPWISIAFIVIFAYGAKLIVVNNFIMDDVSQESTVKQDFDYFDSKFGGVRPFELAISLKDSTDDIWNVNRLKEMEKIENYLSNEYEVNINNSLIQYLSILNRASHAGNTDYYGIPDSKNEIRKFKRMLKIADQGKFIASVLDSTENTTRINGGVPDWGNQKATLENKKFFTFINEEGLDKHLDIHVTGSAHLLDRNMSYMSSSLVEGLAFAIIVVSILMALLFRSFRMLIISIIPNVIPLIIIAGIMGYFGINLKITTAIIFTISFGIAIDDTIHFLSNFKLELKKGKSKLYALKSTYLGTGKAIVLTSAILVGGFSMLLLSNFMGTYYMGLMICITLVVAVVSDLFILPLLLLYFYPDPNKKKEINSNSKN